MSNVIMTIVSLVGVALFVSTLATLSIESVSHSIGSKILIGSKIKDETDNDSTDEEALKTVK